jgi:hypothetical protein
MLPNVKSVGSVIVSCDLDRKLYAVANVLNESVASPPIPLSNLVRKNQFCVCVDATPEPEVPALFLWIHEPTSMRSDELPLLVHFDS